MNCLFLLSLSFCLLKALLILAIHRYHKSMKITKATPLQSLISGCVVWPQIRVPVELVKVWNDIGERNSERLKEMKALRG